MPAPVPEVLGDALPGAVDGLGEEPGDVADGTFSPGVLGAELPVPEEPLLVPDAPIDPELLLP